MNNREATITIDGHTLTTAQSMTIRVALELFAMDLSSGEIKDIEKAYMDRIREIREYIYDH